MGKNKKKNRSKNKGAQAQAGAAPAPAPAPASPGTNITTTATAAATVKNNTADVDRQVEPPPEKQQTTAAVEKTSRRKKRAREDEPDPPRQESSSQDPTTGPAAKKARRKAKKERKAKEKAEAKSAEVEAAAETGPAAGPSTTPGKSTKNKHKQKQAQVNDSQKRQQDNKRSHPPQDRSAGPSRRPGPSEHPPPPRSSGGSSYRPQQQQWSQHPAPPPWQHQHTQTRLDHTFSRQDGYRGDHFNPSQDGLGYPPRGNQHDHYKRDSPGVSTGAFDRYVPHPPPPPPRQDYQRNEPPWERPLDRNRDDRRWSERAPVSSFLQPPPFPLARHDRADFDRIPRPNLAFSSHPRKTMASQYRPQTGRSYSRSVSPDRNRGKTKRCDDQPRTAKPEKRLIEAKERDAEKLAELYFSGNVLYGIAPPPPPKQTDPEHASGHWERVWVEEEVEEKETAVEPNFQISKEKMKIPVPDPPEPTEDYLRLAGARPVRLDRPQPLLVVIDLNGTVLHRPNRKRLSSFVTRPHCHEFLTRMGLNAAPVQKITIQVQKWEWRVRGADPAPVVPVEEARPDANMNIMVWSSAQKVNVEAMVDNLVVPNKGGEERQSAFEEYAKRPELQTRGLLDVWHRGHLFDDPSLQNHNYQVYKKLTKIWANELIQGQYPVLAKDAVKEVIGDGQVAEEKPNIESAEKKKKTKKKVNKDGKPKSETVEETTNEDKSAKRNKKEVASKEESKTDVVVTPAPSTEADSPKPDLLGPILAAEAAEAEAAEAEAEVEAGAGSAVPTIAPTHGSGCWDQTNTILIDDTAEKARSEPANLVLVPTFHGSRRLDEDENGPVLRRLAAYLELAGWYDNVSAFIRWCPFEPAVADLDGYVRDRLAGEPPLPLVGKCAARLNGPEREGRSGSRSASEERKAVGRSGRAKEQQHGEVENVEAVEAVG